jgi:hypothetical protein
MQKKEFNKPEMTKCEQPLDKVTLCHGGYGEKRPRRRKGPFNPA